MQVQGSWISFYSEMHICIQVHLFVYISLYTAINIFHTKFVRNMVACPSYQSPARVPIGNKIYELICTHIVRKIMQS